MKKFILLLGTLLIANTVSYGACEYKCVEPYDMNSSFRTFMSSASGLNFTSEKIAQKILKREIKKSATADNLKVKLESYSSKDLKNGIFKSMSIKGTNFNVNDVYLTYLEMNTLCDFNYIKQSKDNVVFMEDFPMSFNFQMSASDINKTMQSGEYQKVVDDLNKIGKAFGGVKVSSTKVAVKSNKFYYTIGFSIPFIKNEQKLTITSDLKVKNGKIDFANTKLVSDSFKLDLKKINYILNYLNPLDFSVNILDNKDAKVSVKSVSIKDNIINTEGTVVIPKD